MGKAAKAAKAAAVATATVNTVAAPAAVTASIAPVQAPAPAPQYYLVRSPQRPFTGNTWGTHGNAGSYNALVAAAGGVGGVLTHAQAKAVLAGLNHPGFLAYAIANAKNPKRVLMPISAAYAATVQATLPQPASTQQLVVYPQGIAPVAASA
jgi:hypothetical protein